MVGYNPGFGRNCESPRIVILFVSILVAGIVISTYRSTTFTWVISKGLNQPLITKPLETSVTPFKSEFLFDCKPRNFQKRCSVDQISSKYDFNGRTENYTKQENCPAYFRWMFQDLRPWTSTGISENMVERAKPHAHFRLIILNGRVYVERYKKSFQTRDVFTIWGILQLVRLYPGQVRDLDLMFNCFDKSRIKNGRVANNSGPPPLFGYCIRDGAVGLVFPDWSFWGWPEINIKPWESLLKDLEKGNEKLKWVDRQPYAFWKGNPNSYPIRLKLLKCNVDKTKDWNARVYHLDWYTETKREFKNTNLANQCNYRYKIYVEGNAWSVSQKYILACDSMSLLVEPKYHDFFTRGLMPLQHFWPIRADNNLCNSIKLAVDWGNNHQHEAQLIGKAANTFIQQEVKMDYIYDYMLHLLNEYGKLLTYKPKIPPRSREVCLESMVCAEQGPQRKSMMESMVKHPSNSRPCNLQ